MSKYDLEELIKEAYAEKIALGLSADDTGKCLDNETLFGLYEGSLTETAHKSAIEHLGRCDLCCVDLACWIEFMHTAQKSRGVGKEKVDCEVSPPTVVKLSGMDEVYKGLDVSKEQLLATPPNLGRLLPVAKAKVRHDKMTIAKGLADAGFYDTGMFKEAVTPEVVERIANDLECFPIGEASIYGALTMGVMKAFLRGLIDWDSAGRRSLQTSQIDIELPINPEALQKYPLWQHWCRQYAVKSIIIETKNNRCRAKPEDVQRLKSSLDVADKGRFGMLISRSGFSRSSTKILRKYACDDQVLIVPINHNDLRMLLRLSMQDQLEAMSFLRRKETLLLQRT